MCLTRGRVTSGQESIRPGGTGFRHPQVTFDRHLPGDRLLGLGDLLADPAQGPPGPVVAILVVDDRIAPPGGGPGGPGLGEDLPAGDLPGCSRRHWATM